MSRIQFEQNILNKLIDHYILDSDECRKLMLHFLEDDYNPYIAGAILGIMAFKGYRPEEVKSSNWCVGCFQCYFACPDFAIDVIEVTA